jgi:hypothetical protein
VVRRSSPEIGIIKYPFLGLNASGVPQYSNATRVSQAAPAMFTDPHKLEYYPASDRMFIAGFTTGYPSPKDAAGGLGSEIVRFDNWSTGTPTQRWRIAVPLNDTTKALGSSNMPDGAGMSVCGNHMFVVSAMNRRGWVYSIADGARVGEILPGPEIGSSYGWVDIPYGIRAFKRNSGEYTIFVEDDANAKIIMYRWCPSGNCPEVATAHQPSMIAPKGNQFGLSVRATDKRLSFAFAARGKYVLSLYSASGREIARLTGISTGNVSLRPDLSPGLYFINLVTSGQTSSSAVAIFP